MPKEIIIDIGSVFGYWKVLEPAKKGKIMCLCLGCNKTIKLISKFDMRMGKTKSCGCLKFHIQQETNFKRYNNKYVGRYFWLGQLY